MTDSIHNQLVAARRNQILDAAAAVFAEKGFHPTTIRDVARHAGIADGTIYNYFKDKPALLLGVFERMQAAIQPQATALDLDAADLRSLLTAYFRFPLVALQADNYALFRVIVSEMMVSHELRTLYFQNVLEPALAGGEHILREWADRHALRAIDLSLTVRAISALILGMQIEYTLGDSHIRDQWEAIPEFLADLILKGIEEKQP